MRTFKQQTHLFFLPLLIGCLLAGNLSLQAQSQYRFVAVDKDGKTSGQIHIVNKGETLYGVARQHQVSVNEIKSWNGLTSNVIYPGQTLRVETASMIEASPKTEPSLQETESFSRSESQPLLEEVAYDGHLSDLFSSGVSAGQAVAWEEEPTQNDSEWSPFGGDDNFNNRGLAQGGSNARSVGQQTRSVDNAVVTRRRYHEVKQGEDIYSIADQYDVRVDELRAWNALRGDVLPGEVLVVSKHRTASALSSPSNPSSSTTRGASNGQSVRGLAPNPNSRTRSTESMLESSGTPSILSASDRPQLGQWKETGRYVPYEGEGVKGERFYAQHKTLPVGSSINLAIPNNRGYLKVKIVDALPAEREANLGLSIDCIRLLEGANAKQQATIYYDVLP